MGGADIVAGAFAELSDPRGRVFTLLSARQFEACFPRWIRLSVTEGAAPGDRRQKRARLASWQTRPESSGLGMERHGRTDAGVNQDRRQKQREHGDS